jgi:integrase
MRNSAFLRKKQPRVGSGLEGCTQEERSDFFRRAARAQWGPKKIPPRKANDGPWTWPISLERYDRAPHLTRVETSALTRYAEAYRFRRYGRTMDFGEDLDRLIRPLNDTLDYTGIGTNKRKYVLLFFLREMADRKRSFWGWTTEEWIESIDSRLAARQHAVAIAYLLCGFSDLHRLKSDHVVYSCLVRKVFGSEHTTRVSERVQVLLSEWGYRRGGTRDQVMRTIFECLLFIRSPHLKDITIDHLRTVIGRKPPRSGTYCAFAISRVLAKIGAIPEPMEIARPFIVKADIPEITEGVPSEWARLCRRWLETSTVSARYRRKTYYFLLNVGRWLSNEHPEIVSPGDWTRELVAEAVAVTCQWRAGDWCTSGAVHIKNHGSALKASTYAGRISALRVFFRDLQAWELIPRRFDPVRSFTTPKSVLAKIGPNPRIIADDVWAKLMWAGLNLTAEDLPKRGPFQRKPLESSYPVELCKALAVTWLFAGLRNNEILRLRLGCIRWQKDDPPILDRSDTLLGGSICMLDVPVNKTSTAFTKPVDPIVGEMITAWEKVRPNGTKLLDRKTGEAIDFLFLYRLTVVGQTYLNNVLIPTLCRKAGVPRADIRGNITSHRGRSTIASQLFNAKDPMTLFELQEWLGHSTPAATQHYAKITPTKLAKSYGDAGYFGRNLRAIEVLVDQDAVRNGRATTEPWKFYDLGHGYCTYDFFEQCPHRMACARCDFYLPKQSSAALLLEGKQNLSRLLQEIPLSEAERAAVEEGVTSYDALLAKLAEVPTPSGTMRKQLRAGFVLATTLTQKREPQS